MRVRDRSLDAATISTDGVYRYSLTRARILGLLATEQRLAEIIGDIAMCLDTNDNGTPMHELYVPYSTHLKPWHCPPPIARPSRRARKDA